VVGAFREKWIGRIGISRSCRVHRVSSFLYLTRQLRAMVAFLAIVMLSEAKHLRLMQ
jgi:hypothetical protein